LEVTNKSSVQAIMFERRHKHSKRKTIRGKRGGGPKEEGKLRKRKVMPQNGRCTEGAEGGRANLNGKE